jgi:hypothetical protein
VHIAPVPLGEQTERRLNNSFPLSFYLSLYLFLFSWRDKNKKRGLRADLHRGALQGESKLPAGGHV